MDNQLVQKHAPRIWLLLALIASVLAYILADFLERLAYGLAPSLPAEVQLLIITAGYVGFVVPVVFGITAWQSRWKRGPTSRRAIIGGFVGLAVFGLATLAVPGFFLDRMAPRLPWEIRTILKRCDALELLSISPNRNSAASNSAPVAASFEGYPVLGRLTLTDPDACHTTVSALLTSIDHATFVEFGCFNPRHAMRARRGTETVDLLICYECNSVVVLHGKETLKVKVSLSSKAVLNKLLTDAGIPLAPSKHE